MWAQIHALTLERDDTIERYGQAKDMLEKVEQVGTQGTHGDTIRNMVHAGKEIAHWRGLYESVVPPS